MGVTCVADAEVAAPLVVTGSGVYVGRMPAAAGRTSASSQGAGAVTPAGVPADGVRGDVFPAAAVHGGAGIFARGVEIHDAPCPGEFPDDTDRHAGRAGARRVAERGLRREFLLAAEAEATLPGPALDRRAPAARRDRAGDGQTSSPAGGVFSCPPADEVVIEGSPPAEAGRLLVVVRGDAVLGRPGETLALSGGLVVCGRLARRVGLRPSRARLHARSLSIDAPHEHRRAAGLARAALSRGQLSPTLVERGT